MKVEEAIQRMRKTEEFEVFRKEWVEARLKDEQTTAMQPCASMEDTMRCERAKGAFSVLSDMLASIDLDRKEEDDDV